MLLVGIIGLIVCLFGVKRAGDAVKTAEKEVYIRYEQAFAILNKLFFESRTAIYKDEKAQHIVFFHTNLFLNDIKKSDPVTVYTTHQAGIYEDIRFLCSLISIKSDFLSIVPPIPSKIASNKRLMFICKIGILASMLVILFS